MAIHKSIDNPSKLNTCSREHRQDNIFVPLTKSIRHSLARSERESKLDHSIIVSTLKITASEFGRAIFDKWNNL